MFFNKTIDGFIRDGIRFVSRFFLFSPPAFGPVMSGTKGGTEWSEAGFASTFVFIVP